RHTSSKRDWSSDVCSSDLVSAIAAISKSLVPQLQTKLGSALLKGGAVNIGKHQYRHGCVASRHCLEHTAADGFTVQNVVVQGAVGFYIGYVGALHLCQCC